MEQDKLDFLNWVFKKQKPDFCLPETLLKALSKINLQPKKQEPVEIEEEEEDNIEIILQIYPFWSIHDWYFIYDDWISSHYTYRPIQWTDLPSNFINHICPISRNQWNLIREGMPKFLYYINSFRNDKHIFTHADIFNISNLYMNFLFHRDGVLL